MPRQVEPQLNPSDGLNSQSIESCSLLLLVFIQLYIWASDVISQSLCFKSMIPYIAGRVIWLFFCSVGESGVPESSDIYP